MTVDATVRAGCKINLFLRVTGVREDGYHTLESLFLPLETPSDILTVTAGPAGTGLDFTCSDASLATDNILQKTYAAYAKATAYAPDIRVFLEKGIPYGAGLGGGSSDAAALLLYLNDAAERTEHTALSMSALSALAAKLGADVPFFLFRQPALVRGIGEIIEPVPNPVAGMHLVLVCPETHVATAWAFAAWDEKNTESQQRILTNRDGEDTRPLVRGICVHNDLEAVVFERHPELREIVVALKKTGAVAAAMSGSGASLFGLFNVAAKADNAASFFQKHGMRVFRHTL